MTVPNGPPPLDPRVMAQFAQQMAAGGGASTPAMPGAAPAVAGGVAPTAALTGAAPPTPRTHAPGEPDPSYQPEMSDKSFDDSLVTSRKRGSNQPKHVWEQAAEIVTAWVLDMEKAVANALLFHGKSPFAATLNEAQKLAYYRDVLSTPEGRDALMRRAGVDGYVRVIAALAESSPQSLLPPPREQARRDQELGRTQAPSARRAAYRPAGYPSVGEQIDQGAQGYS